MKHVDKVCDAFDALNKEMDVKYDHADGLSNDQDSINIDEIENKIMDKLEKLIENKLGSNSSEPNEPETNDQAENTNLKNNGGDNNED